MFDTETQTRADTVMVMAHSLLSDILRNASTVIDPDSLPALFAAVKAGVEMLAPGDVEEAEEIEPATKAEVKRSITPDHLVSFEDGRPYKTLKRHLAGRGLTPEQYRQKWGLPPDYPMVAANYAAQRSQLAKDSGLGNRRKAQAA